MRLPIPSKKAILQYLFFIGIAATFWLFQAVNQDYEQEIMVPLEFVNVPSNVVITSDLPHSLTLRVRDRGVNLFPYVYGRSRLTTVTIDFNEHANSGGHIRLLTSDLLKPIATKVGFQYIGARPDTLDIYYNYGLCKKVPVQLQGTIQPTEGYTLADIRMDHDSVLVYASKHILDTLTAAWLTPVNYTDIADTLHFSGEVQKVRGAKFKPASTKVHVFTDRMVEKSVQVPVQGVNFPAGKHLQTFPGQVTVTFQVGMKMYREITADNFILVVNYEDLIRSESNRCHLSLKSTPLGVAQVKINPIDVEFIIEEE